MQGNNEMEQILYKLLWSHLQALGLFREKQQVLSDPREQAGINRNYNHWLQASIALLERQQYLHCTRSPDTDWPITCIIVDPTMLKSESLWQIWDQRKECWLQNADLKAQVVLVETMLHALPAILTGKRPATEIMFPNGSMQLVERVYQNNVIADYFNEALAQVLITYLRERLAQDKHARIRILEIGAGTGGTTGCVLRGLQPYQTAIAEYCYSDVSEVFLQHGQETYAARYPYLTYQLFNVEEPPTGQGIEPGSYDLVIAANVLHATSNIRRAVRNAKAALEKRGLLLLNEITSTSLFAHLTFGLLDGWWAYQDPELRIPDGPALTTESWQAVLSDEGFGPIFLPTLDVQGVDQQIIVAESDGMVRQQPTQPAPKSAQVAIPRDSETLPTIAFSHSNGTITDQMVKAYIETIIQDSIAQVLKVERKMIRDDMSFTDYGVDSIVGIKLVNVINEKSHLTLRTTVLFDYNNIPQLVDYILLEHRVTLKALLQESLSPALAVASIQEVLPIAQNIERFPQGIKGNSQEKRLPDWHVLSAHQHKERGGRADSGQKPHASPTYQRVIVARPGQIDDLIIGEADIPELKEHEVRIAVRAFSLNFGDLLCVKGLYPTMPPYPFTPGFEASGVVLEVGRAVTAFKIGASVFAIAGAALGGHASMMICPEEHVYHKPVTLSFEEACALPAVAITMIAAFHKAHLKRGEKILIQTATGGTGLIAIQLAKHYGAQIYATAGSQPKLDYLKRLGVPYQINYREMDFAEEIERLTQGRGVDVVINTLPGDAIQKGINCLAPGGRYIEIAMTALKSARMIDLSTLSQNQSFYSVDLRKLALTDLATFKGYCQEMLQLLENGIIAPTIDQVFAWERLKDAYRYIEERQNIGKIVVRIPEIIQASHVVTSPQSLISATHHEPIAIIGMSGRFAHCKNVNELWEHLAHGTDLIEEVSRWDSKELAPAERREAYCKHGSFLEGIDLFDALFFNISGFEATYMDPQQRLVLEECWKALEDAGYVGTSIEGQQCGVYVGCAVGDYQRLLEDMPPAQAFWGNAGSVIPARIAYYLNLQGPAIAIDTACSSSLVAMHLACQGLWSGEIDMALAGGVFLQCTPEFYQLANRAGMLSATGHCYTFDDRADGFVPGEGVGMVVLKRLKEALASGDHIYGVIRGSSINQDGATRGITVPSANSQERLLRSVYEKFQVDPAQIQMMEAHGTGTKLGDPIEYDALTRAFRKYTEKQEYCALGSIKTNLGHTAGAAGVAGVIKILLSLQHKQIPPSLHFQSGNAHIQFKESPFYVNTRLQDWKPGVQDTEPPLGGQAQGTAPSKPQTPTLECPAEGDKARRCAAISSFGFSGTNAHMVIEEAPEQTRSHVEMPSYLIVLSARTEDQLHQQVEQLVVFLSQDDQAVSMIDCGNISYTLLVGRKHLKYRLTCIIRNCRELESLLREWLEKGKVPQISVSNLQQHEQSENASLKQYGNQCLKDCQSTLESVVYLARLSAIAELYLQGYTLAFELLFANSDYSRVSLPTYPFARERYWVPTATSKDSTRLLPTNSLVQNPKTFWGMGGFGDTPNPAREASPPGPPSPTTSLVKDSTRLLPANSLVQSPKTFWGMGGFGDTPNPAREASPPGPPSPTTSLVSALVSDKQTQHSLPSITQVETSFASDMSKSRPISLRPLLSVPTPANELVQQSPPPLTLPNANMILSTSHSKGQSQVAIPTEKRKSAQSLQDELILSLAGMLAVKPSDIDIDASFIDMGLDSVMGVEWIQILNNQYGLSLTATKVYDYPTIRSFAVFLWKERATCEEEVKPEKLPASSLLSLQEIMQKVQDGRLNIEQADALFHQYAKSFS